MKIPLALLAIVSFNLLAQVLPVHEPLRILILSDEVNPHNLTDQELTQPGDISSALNATTALNSPLVLEIPTNQIEQVTTELLREENDPLAYDVLIYFAHRIPDDGNNAQSRQNAFVVAVEQFLQKGGGVISFHHGIYLTSGKNGMQNLLGAQATGSVPWNTTDGQDVINVAGDHFIANYAMNYPLQIAYENTALSIPAAIYPAFNNTPDERYPQMVFNSGNTGCDIQPVFESDYQQNGGNHLLAYSKHCPLWKSQVFVYQPGEYQPNALSGNNFQILLNAIYYLSAYRWDIVYVSGFD